MENIYTYKSMIYNAAILLHEVYPTNWAASIHYWIRVSLPQKADGSTGWSEELKLWSTSEDLSHLESKAGDISLCICSRRSPAKFTRNQRATSRKTKYSIYIYMYICFAFAQEPERRGLKTGTSWKGGRRVESMAGIALGGWLRHRLGGWGAGMVRPGLGAPVVCLWREGRCRKKERGKEVL